MNDRPTNVAVLGSTGSIGQSTLAVIAESGGRFRALALSTNTNRQRIIEQAIEFAPQCIVVADQRQAAQLDVSQLPAGTELFSGAEGLSRVAALDEVDVVVAAIVGSAGFSTTQQETPP